MTKKSQNILSIDIGGTNVKIIDKEHKEPIKIPSGLEMTPSRMVQEVKKAAADWTYTVVAMGYPGPVKNNQPQLEPHNLAQGWVGFDFEKAFGKPVRIINDAAMQALGSYEGGNMLFLGLGTGLGSALVVGGVLVPLELAHLPYKKGLTYEECVGVRALKKNGKKAWRKDVLKVCEQLKNALTVESVVLGGGNAKVLKELPGYAKLGANANAFRGGFRMWDKDDQPEESAKK